MSLPRSKTILNITRTVRFCAAHRYHNPALSAERNREVFGACNREHGHGHNYRVECTVQGTVDPQTGMVMNLTDLDAILQREVVGPLDHSFLNYDIAHFAETIPTCENLAAWLYDQLEVAFSAGQHRLQRVRVWESDDLWAEVERP